MQDIKKQCDKCKKTDKIKKTIDDPDPASTIETIKIKGRGKNLGKLHLDLCSDCHLTFTALSLKWVSNTASLDDFLNTREAEKVG